MKIQVLKAHSYKESSMFLPSLWSHLTCYLFVETFLNGDMQGKIVIYIGHMYMYIIYSY